VKYNILEYGVVKSSPCDPHPVNHTLRKDGSGDADLGQSHVGSVKSAVAEFRWSNDSLAEVCPVENAVLEWTIGDSEMLQVGAREIAVANCHALDFPQAR
jgi:hypothetical protein